MFKSNLIRKTVKIVAIGTICLSLAIPYAVNAVQDVYKPEKTVVPICDFTDATDDNLNTDYASPEYVNENSTVSVSPDKTDGNQKIKVTTIPQADGGKLDNSYFVLKKDQTVSLKNEKAPYLVFNMKAGASGNAEMKFNINTPNGRYPLNENAVLERSKDFSNSNEKVEEFKVTEGGAFSGYFLSNTEYYEYRLNLKQALGNAAYANIGEWWGIAISIYNWAQTDYYYDDFRLESGDRGVYQTFDGIEDADKAISKDVWWDDKLSPEIVKNSGFLNSPALKLSGTGGKSTIVAFDGDKSVPVSGKQYLYMYMDVEVDKENALGYKPSCVNMEFDLTDKNGVRYRLIGNGSMKYANTLDGLFNGGSKDIPDGNNGYLLRVPVGKHWFSIDISKVENATGCKDIKGLYIQYNRQQEDKDGNWEWANFTNIPATFIIDSISTSVKDFKSGDADGNGVIDILDLVTVNECIDIYQPVVASADTNSDNQLNGDDLAGIRSIILNQSL